MSAVKALSVFKNIDFQLQIETGVDAGRAFRIRPPKVSIGRDSNCSVTLSDPRISRLQCEIEFRDHIVIIDKSNRSSTFVNGKPITDHKIVPNDILSFGDTRIRFLAKGKKSLTSVKKDTLATSSSLGAKLRGNKIAGMAPQKKRSKAIYVILALGVLAAVYFVNQSPATQAKSKTLTTSEELQQQILESKLYKEKLQENLFTKRQRDDQNYQSAVESHFIRGFRDLQSHNYNRAAQAFGATVAKDPDNLKAQRYQNIARQKQEESIEKHLFYGEQYRGKLMYNRCASEFQKAMVLLNRPKSEKYKLAKARKSECQLLQSGGRSL